MPILLFCQYCTAEHSISGMRKPEDLTVIAAALGWELTTVGWLCPLHRSELLPILSDKAREARFRWLDAISEFDRAMSDASSGLVHPDGSLRIEQAGRKRAAAFSKYRDAFAKYKDALNRSHISSGFAQYRHHANRSDAADGKSSDNGNPNDAE